ncbi:MAG: heavy-metal-associated domain-containing protein, partial [Candidatus Poseidoniaceae archaeon]
MGLFSKSQTFEFKVSGMDCGGCERKVSSALTKIHGVKKVEASASEGTVIV